MKTSPRKPPFRDEAASLRGLALLGLLGLGLGLGAATTASAQAFAYSQKPPGGLTQDKVPMFVVYGFDDNARVEGIQWFTNYVRTRKNPAGNGNAATFDGTPVRATWFLTGNYIHSEGFVTAGSQTLNDITNAWKTLYQDGHEIANHTWSHPHGSGLDLEGWKDQIRKSNEHLSQSLGVPVNKIKGFRTPFLEYTPTTLQALKDLGFTYDCSIEFGFNGWQPQPGDSGNWNSMTNPETHKKLWWPYTLDNGSPPGNASKGNPTQAGLWEIPVYTYLKADGSGEVTGFDFNLWKVATKDQFVATLKRNFDLRRAGNRNPLTINSHSDYYTQYNDDANKEFTYADWQTRQRGMEEFLDYVLQFPETRIVTYSELIDWMKNPVPLGSNPGSFITRGDLRAAALTMRTGLDGALELRLPARGEYRLSLFTPDGRRAQHRTQNFEAGVATLRFDRPLKSGVYYAVLSGGGHQVRQKVVLNR